MKISEVITALQAKLNELGDVECLTFDAEFEGYHRVEGIASVWISPIKPENAMHGNAYVEFDGDPAGAVAVCIHDDDDSSYLPGGRLS